MVNQHGLLTPLPMSVARWRTSMFGDDATIFINPLKDDLEVSRQFSQAFGTFSGLHINLQKSYIHPRWIWIP
jgi:hypothetical protein